MTTRGRGRKTRRSGGLRRALPWLVAGGVIAPVVLLGSHPGWAVAVSTLILGGVGLVAARLGRQEPIVWTPAHYAVLGAAVWTGLQLLPLPAAVVSWISPRSLAPAIDAARALGEAPPWTGTLSWSPTDTLRALFLSLAIAGAFFGASAATRVAGRQTIALAGVAGILAAGLVTLAHEIVDADAVYGFYRFPIPPGLMGPIGNQNQLAGLLAMGVPVLAGLAIDEEAGPRRAALLTAATFCGVTALACVSRGGVLSLIVGMVVLVVLVLRSARREKNAALARRATVALGLVALVGVGLGLGTWAFEGAISRDFEASPTSKLELAFRTLVLAGDAPAFGVGRGAFHVAYTELASNDRVFHPENLLVQWVDEWGVPTTLLLLGALAVAWLRAASRSASATQAGALAATLSIFVHDQVDFGLERLSVAATAAVLFAVALAPSRRAGTETAVVRAPWLGTLAAALCVVFALAFGHRLHATDRQRIEGELLELAERGEAAPLLAAGRDAMRAHPSEPVFPLVVGWGLGDSTTALAWLNRAMELAPSWPSPHAVVARWLARHGHLGQAWLEVRETLERRATPSGEELCMFAAIAPDATEILRIFDREPLRSTVLSRIASCAEATPELTAELDRALIESTAPDAALAARVRIARRALEAGDPAEAAHLLEGADDSDWSVRFLRADLALDGDRPADAVAVLEPHAPVDLEPRRLELLARAHTAAGDDEAMRRTVAELRTYAAGSGPDLARNALLLGQLEERLDNAGRAYAAYEDARDFDPTSGALRRIAALAEREGDRRRAYLAWAELCRSEGAGSHACEAAERTRRTEGSRDATVPRLP